MKTVKTKIQAMDSAVAFMKKTTEKHWHIVGIETRQKDFCTCGFGCVVHVKLSSTYITKEEEIQRVAYTVCPNPECVN